MLHHCKIKTGNTAERHNTSFRNTHTFMFLKTHLQCGNWHSLQFQCFFFFLLFSFFFVYSNWCSCLILIFFFLLEMVCDPLGDYNVWGSTKPLNNTAKGHKEGESMVIAATRVSGSTRLGPPLGVSCTEVTHGWPTQVKTTQFIYPLQQNNPPCFQSGCTFWGHVLTRPIQFQSKSIYY